MKKDILLFSLSSVLLVSLVSCDRATTTINKADVVIHIGEVEDVESSFYYVNGVTSIPYLEMDDAMTILLANRNILLEDAKYSLTGTYEGDGYTMKKKGGPSVYFDFASETVTFSSRSAFQTESYSKLPLDPAVINQKEGKSMFYAVDADSSFFIPGKPVTFDLAKYGIHMWKVGNKGYIPLSTFSDLFFSPSYTYLTEKNGEGYILQYGFQDNETLRNKFWAKEVGIRDKDVAEYTYNELCFVMDNLYGFKSREDDYDALLSRAGLKDKIKSTDARASSLALADFFQNYIDDLHTAYFSEGFYGPYGRFEGSPLGSSREKYQALMAEYQSAREAALGYSGKVYDYSRVGDTAFITFDSFDFDPSKYGETVADLSEVKDTVSLLQYARNKLLNEDSDVKNVVYDISCNGGGDTVALYYASGFLSGESVVHIQSPIDGSKTSVAFKVDSSGDKAIGEDDKALADKKLFVLESELSFSCGNAFPNIIADNRAGTLIGKTSGGGACCIAPYLLPDGSLYQISGECMFSTKRNGDYLSNEQGAVPDINLAPSSFYNRSKLVSIIDNYVA